MRRLLRSCGVRVCFCSLAVLLLASQVCAQGVELEEGARAPFSGVLIRAEELAAVVLEKNAEIEKLRLELQHAREVAAINADYCERDVGTLREEIGHLNEKNLALERKMQLLEDRVGRWRFGLGLLLVKSPW